MGFWISYGNCVPSGTANEGDTRQKWIDDNETGMVEEEDN